MLEPQSASGREGNVPAIPSSRKEGAGDSVCGRRRNLGFPDLFYFSGKKMEPRAPACMKSLDLLPSQPGFPVSLLSVGLLVAFSEGSVVSWPILRKNLHGGSFSKGAPSRPGWPGPCPWLGDQGRRPSSSTHPDPSQMALCASAAGTPRVTLTSPSHSSVPWRTVPRTPRPVC